ncbi:MAG TPA: acyltransferase [Halanaerobiales bacterium]|nr:acyltransferase [Halanaerobiales bacterium]
MIKKTIFNSVYLFLKLFGGKNFSNKSFHPFVLLKFFYWQKILRINGNVPWPVHFTSQVRTPKKIVKGTRNPGMALGCYIDGRNGIIIEENVWIGPKVSLISMNHCLDNFQKYEKTNPIKIGKNSWIGANTTILPGVELGEHVIVAAGAIVTKSFKEKNIVLGGNPAKIIKEISDYKPI